MKKVLDKLYLLKYNVLIKDKKVLISYRTKKQEIDSRNKILWSSKETKRVRQKPQLE